MAAVPGTGEQATDPLMEKTTPSEELKQIEPLLLDSRRHDRKEESSARVLEDTETADTRSVHLELSAEPHSQAPLLDNRKSADLLELLVESPDSNANKRPLPEISVQKEINEKNAKRLSNEKVSSNLACMQKLLFLI